VPEVARRVDDVADEFFEGFGFWWGEAKGGRGLVVVLLRAPRGRLGVEVEVGIVMMGAEESEWDCETRKIKKIEKFGIDEKNANLLATSARRLERLPSSLPPSQKQSHKPNISFAIIL